MDFLGFGEEQQMDTTKTTPTSTAGAAGSLFFLERQSSYSTSRRGAPPVLHDNTTADSLDIVASINLRKAVTAQMRSLAKVYAAHYKGREQEVIEKLESGNIMWLA